MSSFDKLLDAYAQIGDAMPGLQQYQGTFDSYPALATVLEDYYSDILTFHHEALRVFNRSRWEKAFHSTWKTFNSKFDPILQSLKGRRELLESEKSTATLYEIQNLRESINTLREEDARRAMREESAQHKRRLVEIREKIQAPDYRADQEFSSEIRHGRLFGAWFFEHDAFKSWYDRHSPSNRVLYVHGKPGAGKTILVSSVIGRILDQAAELRDCSCSISYFYFKHDQPDKRTHRSLLRAVLDQLITQETTLSHELLDDFSSIDSCQLSIDRLQTFTRTAFESYRHRMLLWMELMNAARMKPGGRSIGSCPLPVPDQTSRDR